MAMSVDLPDPERPTTATCSPRRMSTVTSRSASTAGGDSEPYDIAETFTTMRGGMFHLRDRRPDVYGPLTELDATGTAGWRDLAHA